MQQSKLSTARVHDLTFESIQKVRTKAEEYDERAEKYRKKDKSKRMLENESKTHALRLTKIEAVNELLKKNLVDKAELHEIDGEEHVCVWFDDWAFHQPVQLMKNRPDLFPKLANNGEVRKINDIDSSPGKQSNNSTLKGSLLLLENRFGLNANDYLYYRYVGPYFTGWNYLGQ